MLQATYGKFIDSNMSELPSPRYNHVAEDKEAAILACLGPQDVFFLGFSAGQMVKQV